MAKRRTAPHRMLVLVLSTPVLSAEMDHLHHSRVEIVQTIAAEVALEVGEMAPILIILAPISIRTVKLKGHIPPPALTCQDRQLDFTRTPTLAINPSTRGYFAVDLLVRNP